MAKQVSMFDAAIVRGAVKDSFKKLDPRILYKNPVMFVVAIGSLLTTALVVRDLAGAPAGAAPLWFSIAITLWLWFTVRTSPKPSRKVAARRKPMRCARCARTPRRGA
jgi:potassium-transporting ATPase ATP-binding subunit